MSSSESVPLTLADVRAVMINSAGRRKATPAQTPGKVTPGVCRSRNLSRRAEPLVATNRSGEANRASSRRLNLSKVPISQVILVIAAKNRIGGILEVLDDLFPSPLRQRFGTKIVARLRPIIPFH